MIKVSFSGLRERLQTLDRRLYRCDDREEAWFYSRKRKHHGMRRV